MDEEDKSVDIDEVSAPAAEEQQETAGEITQDAAEEPGVQDVNWTKARDTMAEQSGHIKDLQAELAQIRGSQKVTPQQQQKAQSLFEGRDDDDILTVSDLKKALKEQDSEYKQQISELSTRSQYSDYTDVIEKYGKQLPDAIKQAIVNAPNPHEAAYQACRDSAAYYKDQLMSEKHTDAKKASKNLKKPGSASSVGGGGVLSKASLYEQMSSEEIIAMGDKFIRG